MLPNIHFHVRKNWVIFDRFDSVQIRFRKIIFYNNSFTQIHLLKKVIFKTSKLSNVDPLFLGFVSRVRDNFFGGIIN